ncbi:phosphatidylserine decarboxylase [Alteribacter aurantiacus]|uniref:phosphatidylserine decarboxylase n=1 Tax=Alteribacter aurantiacus TaxID=254410 RepID=UPI0004225F30|nr:phosphatidylserine decarboxylase [Alteribacter aurantiacus]
MKKKVYRSLMELTKSPVQSWGIRKFTTSRVSKPLIRSFANVYKINLDESKNKVTEFDTLQSLFIRELKPGLRQVAEGHETIVSPVDGTLSETGGISEDATFTIKGQTYDVNELVGLEETGKRYLGGRYMLFYLSPTDYHRIHSPVEGEIVKTWALGNHSSPVNPLALSLGDKVLAKNYRLLTEVSTEEDQRVCIVKIGALNVNSIHPRRAMANGTVLKGEEMAYFSFGSSVMLLFEKGMVAEPLLQGKVKYGEAVATITK